MLCVGACAHPAAVRGRRALDERAFRLAASELTIAVREQPDETSYWVDLGRAQVGLGAAAEAARAFGVACERSPRTPRLWVYLGHAHELGRDYDRAEIDYRRAIALAPDRAWLHRVLGARLLRWGRPDEAVEPLRRARALDPHHQETHNALATALFRAGQPQQAERVFKRAIAAFPEARSLRLGLAVVLLEEGREREALMVYAKVLESWPHFAPAHAGRSLILQDLGEWASAERELEEAIRKAPWRDDYRAQLAALRQRQPRFIRE